MWNSGRFPAPNGAPLEPGATPPPTIGDRIATQAPLPLTPASHVSRLTSTKRIQGAAYLLAAPAGRSALGSRPPCWTRDRRRVEYWSAIDSAGASAVQKLRCASAQPTGVRPDPDSLDRSYSDGSQDDSMVSEIGSSEAGPRAAVSKLIQATGGRARVLLLRRLRRAPRVW